MNKELQEELDTFKDLEAVAHSNGGKILIKALLKDIVSAIESLSFKTHTLEEYISYGARIKEKLDLLRTLTRAEKNKKLITNQIKEELEKTLQE